MKLKVCSTRTHVTSCVTTNASNCIHIEMLNEIDDTLNYELSDDIWIKTFRVHHRVSDVTNVL